MAKSKKYESENDIHQRLLGVAKSIPSKSSESPAEEVQRSGKKDINFAGAEMLGERAKIRKISNRIILDSGTNLERALKLMSGLISCPNGGTETVLNYDIGEYKGVYSDVEVAKVLPILVNYLRDDVKLHNDVFSIVYRCLATDGADIEVYFPNTIMANLINSHGKVESEALQSTLTIKAKEDIFKDNSLMDNITITNNSAILLKSLAMEKGKHIQASLEAEKNKRPNGTTVPKKLDLEVKNILNMRRSYKRTNTLRLNTSIKEDATGMLVKSFPSESISPLHLNGPDEAPIVYIALIDPTTGLPIQAEDDINFNEDLASKRTDQQGERFRVLGRSVGVNDYKVKNISTGIEQLYEKFKTNVLETVTKTLLEGTYQDEFQIEQDNQIIDIMFHRFLRDQKVQILVLDPDTVSYIAADKNRFGVGESLVTKTESLALMHVTLFYATFLANLENAIPRKKMRASMSEYDTDQEKSIEIIMGEYAKALKSPMDWNLSGNRSLLDNLARHGLQLEIENVTENSDLPNFNIQIEDIKRQIEAADETFLDWMGKQVIQKLNMSAELVDQSHSPEFSSEVARDNDVTARQMSEYIAIFNDGFTDRGIKRIANNPQIMYECTEALGKDSEVKLAAMLSRFTATLPNPEVSAFERDIEKLEKIATVIETILESIMPDWLADAMSETDVEELQAQREVVKAALMRDFILRNNAFRGMIESISNGDLDDAIENEFAIAGNISKTIAKNSDTLKRVAAGIAKRRTKLNDKIANGEDEEGDTPTVTPEPADTPQEDVVPEDENTPQETADEDVADEPVEEPAPTGGDTGGEGGEEFNFDDLPQ